ncbi:MAG: tRNA (N6-isopentenyl adenosine(37)-C2)-methylthiotransferase MiaB [Candidatus Omnitrophota bacterium]
MKQEDISKKVFIRTLGCQMNARDSEVICGILGKAGYKIIDLPEEADVIIFNTCSVRQHAEEKVWSEIGRISKRFKKQGQSPSGTVPVIGLVGCMAQNYKEGIFERSPHVSFVVGPQDIHRIPEIAERLISDRRIVRCAPLRKIWETDGEIRPEEIYHAGFYKDKEHAFVVISEGCSNFCSYCIVPYVRGLLRHRNYKDIIQEIEEAVKNNKTKITLLGQNVNAYESQINFIGLLKLINKIKGLKEFSFVTSHPKDTSKELFKVMNELDNLKKCLHLPIQSGSDRVLKLMNRQYSVNAYIDLAKEFRKIIKNGVLTTDIIVGFPTEAEEDFMATYDLMKKLKFDGAYIFKYSVRPHTEAAKMVDDIPRHEKEKRHQLILELQKNISKRKKC